MEMIYSCFGDSITSDQVTGIGTRVSELLGAELFGNFAWGWATSSDWYYGDEMLTRGSFLPQGNYSPENVLSNQVRRFLAAPGHERVNVIYIAISTNDGSVDWCTKKGTPTPVFDDCETVFSQTYEELTRKGVASSLRWAIETLKQACPNAEIFAATPLQAWSPVRERGALGEESGLLKRQIVQKICDFCHVACIDSYLESGYTREVAKDHGEVHPDALWKENIARFVSERIRGFRSPESDI